MSVCLLIGINYRYICICMNESGAALPVRWGLIAEVADAIDDLVLQINMGPDLFDCRVEL